MNLFAALAVVLVCACLAFALLYLLARGLDNYGIVDIAWAFGFAPAAVFYGCFGAGWLPRRIVLAAMVVLWSVRLGAHLWRRVVGHHPVEDGRYGQLRRDWAANFAPKMFGFFLLQAALLTVLSVPFALPVASPKTGFHPLELTGAALWFVALIGETLADSQLAAFKRRPENAGRVCAVGLWRYSRHPNYFFEWLAWVAFFVFNLASPWGWVTAFAPALMLYFLLRVTGLPLTEEQAVRSRGDAYRRYQQSTSAFVPWFPRNSP